MARAVVFAPVIAVRSVALGIWWVIAFIGRTIARTGAALVALVRGVARGIWGAVTGTIGLFVAGVRALGHGVSAACAFVWNRITAAGAAVVWFARSGFAAIARRIHAAFALVARSIVFARAALVALVRGVARGIRGAVTGTLGLLVAGVRAVGHGASAVCVFVWTSLAAAGTAVVSFARAVLVGLGRGIQNLVARTMALIRSGFVATARGTHAIVASVAGTVAFAHAVLIALAQGVARGTRVVAAFTATVAALIGASLVSLARGTAGGLRRLAARTTAALRAGLGAAILSGRAAHANLVRRALCGRAAALEANAAGRTRLSVLARQARDTGGELAARIRYEAAAAGTAIAGAPQWRRRGLTAPMLAVVLGAVVATSSAALVMSRRPAAQPVAAAAPVETSPQEATTPNVPAVMRASLPAADVNQVGSRASASTAVARTAIDRDRSLANTRMKAPNTSTTVNPARVRAIWQNTDTRSLDRALSALRSATLALYRCDMQITSTDRAVAHCDEARGGDEADTSRRRYVKWTIDFRRPGDRWLIDGIAATNSSARPTR